MPHGLPPLLCFGPRAGRLLPGDLLRKAESLGVTGFARNLPDGRVEVLAAGDEAAVEEFVAWLWEGSPASKVTASPPNTPTRRWFSGTSFFGVTLAAAEVIGAVPARPLVDHLVGIPALADAAVVARQRARDVVVSRA